MPEFLGNGAWAGIGVLAAVLVPVLGWLFRRVIQWRSEKRAEKQRVRNLLEYLWSHRVLQKPYSLIDTLHPVQSAKSVRGLRIRLSAALAEFPDESKATQPIRDMHNACLKFLAEFESLPMPKGIEDDVPLFEWHSLPDELITAEWKLGGKYNKRFHIAVTEMQEVFESCIDKLYEEYDVEKPPPHEEEMVVLDPQEMPLSPPVSNPENQQEQREIGDAD